MADERILTGCMVRLLGIFKDPGNVIIEPDAGSVTLKVTYGGVSTIIPESSLTRVSKGHYIYDYVAPDTETIVDYEYRCLSGGKPNLKRGSFPVFDK